MGKQHGASCNDGESKVVVVLPLFSIGCNMALVIPVHTLLLYCAIIISPLRTLNRSTTRAAQRRVAKVWIFLVGPESMIICSMG